VSINSELVIFANLRVIFRELDFGEFEGQVEEFIEREMELFYCRKFKLLTISFRVQER
jgi:hypothetical protein